MRGNGHESCGMRARRDSLALAVFPLIPRSRGSRANPPCRDEARSGPRCKARAQPTGGRNRARPPGGPFCHLFSESRPPPGTGPTTHSSAAPAGSGAHYKSIAIFSIYLQSINSKLLFSLMILWLGWSPFLLVTFRL